MPDEMEKAKELVEQVGYAGTPLEPYIVYLKRHDKDAGVTRFNPYMTVDGRIKELRDAVGLEFGLVTLFNTGDTDTFCHDYIVPARSCVAVLTIAGHVHVGTASIGTGGFVDKTNPFENAETSAVGRALGLAGFGLIPGSAGIASAEEVVGARGREQASAPVTANELGQVRISDRGWGKDKKFAGLTFKEVYELEDGYGAMEWAAGLDDPSGITAQMARYFEMMQGDDGGIPHGMTMEEYDDAVNITPAAGIVMIDGRRVAADEVLTSTWAQYVARKAAQATGEDRLFGHQKHLTNHIKKWFRVAKIMDMTGRQAAAFVRYINSHGKDMDPAFYTEADSEEEQLFGPKMLDELLAEASDGLPGDDPRLWFKGVCEQFGLGPTLTAKQMEGLRKLLALVIAGTMDLSDADDADPMYQVFATAMEKIADDA